MNKPLKQKTWKYYLWPLMRSIVPVILVSGAVQQYYVFQLNKSNQIIQIRQKFDPIVEKILKLSEEYRLILDKYPDSIFQDTEDGAFTDTEDSVFIKISKEDIEKLMLLENRLNLLKENYLVYEKELAKLEGRNSKNINKLTPSIQLN